MRIRNLVLMLLTFVLFVSCGKKDENTIRIGAILSLTGTGAEYGKDQQRAIELLRNKINEQKNKFQYQIFYEDSKSDPKIAVNSFQILIARNRINVGMTVLSSVSMALKPIAEKNRIPLFCVGANPYLTVDSKFVFRSLATSEYQTKILAKHLIHINSKINRIAILYYNDDFGVGCKNSFITEIISSNKTIVAQEAINQGQTEYRNVITKLLRSNPDVLFVANYGTSLALTLRKIREMGYKGIILSTLEVAYPEVLNLAGTASNGVVFADTKYSIDQNNNSFIKEFYNTYHKYPTLDAILAHDELNVIVSTIEKRNISPMNFEKIKGDSLKYLSPIGEFNINKNGDFLYPLVLKKIVNGKPTLFTNQ